MTQDAMKLALGQLQAGFVGNAMQILREALAEHAMQEVQRLGREIEQAPYSVQQAYAMAKVCLDLHKAIGCKWGDNVYLAIVRLKAAAQPPQRTWVNLTDEDRNDCLVEADPCECLATPEAQELMRCVEAKLKELNHGK